MAKFKPGTYTASAQGKMGPVTCEVTFTEDAIKNVSVTDHKEVRGVGYGLPTSPIETIPGLIVEHQSLGIPTVRGARFTSVAILGAVADCCTQAGGDAEALKNVPMKNQPAPKDETITVDIAVVGGGAAGLASAISSLENGAKNVILVEKQGITGGSTARSGGKLLASGTKWQTKQGIFDSPQMLLEYMQGVGGDLLETAKLKNYCDNAYSNMLWLEKMGYTVQDVEAIHKSIIPWRVHNSMGGGGMTMGQGGEISTPMTHKFLQLGGKFSYNTTLTKLLTDKDGAVVGLVAKRDDGTTLTINAQAVIIATGGYANNREMSKRYPEYGNYTTEAPRGNLGEGLLAAEAVGARNFEHPTMQSNLMDKKAYVGIWEEAGLILNAECKRVCNEYTYMYHIGDVIAKGKYTYAWYIASESDPHPMIKGGLQNPGVRKANSLEELAKLMDVDAAALIKSVNRYNELSAAGYDHDFHKPVEHMYPITGPTYMAFKLEPGVTVTFGGLDINLESRVRDDFNVPIKGLFAAGEVAFTGFYGREYPTCGSGIGFGIHYGRIAGRNAANELK